ncbi:MAG TPA: pyrroloquinoline quinone biosynthesis protein PqqB [Candidatus Acidoferrales bacterium]|nr:pyrroloquinoline quinone biosynthesis protein PqqB [Candidatus Acidoferrales bacterium]
MRVKVLGSAAGGGFPQWNCGCANCSRLRAGLLKGPARTQTQVAVSPAKGSWFLINASPDLRQQLLADPDFAPASESRGTRVAAVILTSADVDCVMGLLHLREFQSFRIYSTASVRRILTEENTLFRTLERARPPVQWETLPLDQSIPLSQHEPALSCTAVSLGGSFPDYVSDGLRRSLPENEAVIGLELVQNEKRFLYAPSLPEGGKTFRHRATQSSVALLDGTFWTDDELIHILGSGKTARQMGHLPLSGPDGLLEGMRAAQNVRRILIHLNNTNPALDEESAENRAVRQAGWEIAYDGMEFEL